MRKRSESRQVQENKAYRDQTSGIPLSGSTTPASGMLHETERAAAREMDGLFVASDGDTTALSGAHHAYF